MNVMESLGEAASAQSSPDKKLPDQRTRPEMDERQPEVGATSGNMADPGMKTLEKKEKMANVEELSGHQGLSTSDKVRARLQAVKAEKLKEAKDSVM